MCMRMMYKSIDSWAQKCWVMTEESDDDAALWAQQIQKEQKPVKKSKYQWLNRFRSSNCDVNLKGNLLMNETEERDITLMQRNKT